MTNKSGRILLYFGLAVAALILVFTGWQQHRHTTILSTQDWCARAIKAEQIVGVGRDKTSCGEIMIKQIGALATNSHIYAIGGQLIILFIIVVMVANGRLSLSVNRGGVNANMGKDDVEEAAQAVADEAQGAADEIKAGIAPTKAAEELPSYAKP